jgi:hypothetical protein
MYDSFIIISNYWFTRLLEIQLTRLFLIKSEFFSPKKICDDRIFSGVIEAILTGNSISFLHILYIYSQTFNREVDSMNREADCERF